MHQPENGTLRSVREHTRFGQLRTDSPARSISLHQDGRVGPGSPQLFVYCRLSLIRGSAGSISLQIARALSSFINLGFHAKNRSTE